jgi:hypothetical protein
MADILEITALQLAFLANRIQHFARRFGITSQEAITGLGKVSARHGEDKITGIIDQVVPPELHSSQMPRIINEHYGNP